MKDQKEAESKRSTKSKRIKELEMYNLNSILTTAFLEEGKKKHMRYRG